MISLKNICKDFISPGGIITQVLKEISFDIASGEYVAIMGPSGSGKSTLLNILGCLEPPTSGEYQLNNQLTSALTDAQSALLRRETIGFVFQSFHLLPRRTVLQNIMLPLHYSGKYPNIRERALQLLERMKLQDHAHKYPAQMSGGQQQRVAIARAIANDPKLILADEPTGNLDTATSKEILSLFRELNEEEGITIALVTHSPEVMENAKRLLLCVDGTIHYDGPPKEGLKQ